MQGEPKTGPQSTITSGYVSAFLIILILFLKPRYKFQNSKSFEKYECHVMQTTNNTSKTRLSHLTSDTVTAVRSGAEQRLLNYCA